MTTEAPKKYKPSTLFYSGREVAVWCAIFAALFGFLGLMVGAKAAKHLLCPATVMMVNE